MRTQCSHKLWFNLGRSAPLLRGRPDQVIAAARDALLFEEFISVMAVRGFDIGIERGRPIRGMRTEAHQKPKENETPHDLGARRPRPSLASMEVRGMQVVVVPGTGTCWQSVAIECPDDSASMTKPAWTNLK